MAVKQYLKLNFLIISSLFFISCNEETIPSGSIEKVLGYSCSGEEFQKAFNELNNTGLAKKFYLDRKLGKKNLSHLLITRNVDEFKHYDTDFSFDSSTVAELMKNQASLYNSKDVIEIKVLSKTVNQITGSFKLERKGVGKCRLLYNFDKNKNEITGLYIAGKGTDDFTKSFEVF